MPKLLDNRLIGLNIADVATTSFVGIPPGSVLQVAPNGQSLILGPVSVAAGTVITGPTGAGVGATGATGPAGPATVQSVGLRYQLFTTPGNFAWLVPNNVTHVIINAVAGGGGGQAGIVSGGEGSSESFGSMGQSGGSLRVTAQVTPGSIISGVIGSAGKGEDRIGFLTAEAGTATSVGGLVSVNDNSSVNSLICNGGLGGGGGSVAIWYSPTDRASTSPVGLVSPFLAEYGVGGAGGFGYDSGKNGKPGAVLIEWVSVS